MSFPQIPNQGTSKWGAPKGGGNAKLAKATQDKENVIGYHVVIIDQNSCTRQLGKKKIKCENREERREKRGDRREEEEKNKQSQEKRQRREERRAKGHEIREKTQV